MDNWVSVDSDIEIKYLLDFYGGFHDSSIKELKYESGTWVDSKKSMCMGNWEDNQVEVIFHRQGEPISIELLFVGMRKMNIVRYQDYFCDIFDCYLGIRNDLIPGLDKNLIIWTDDGRFSSKESLDRQLLSEPGISYIIADKLFWRGIQS